MTQYCLYNDRPVMNLRCSLPYPLYIEQLIRMGFVKSFFCKLIYLAFSISLEKLVIEERQIAPFLHVMIQIQKDYENPVGDT